MSTNTFKKAQKEVVNDAIKELIDSSVFLGVTSYEPVIAYSPVQGSNYGYSSGAYVPIYGAGGEVIEKFSFNSSGNSVDVGDLTEKKGDASGQSSSTDGYVSGGWSNPYTYRTSINKFSFASGGNAAASGTVLGATRRYYAAGQSSTENGYISGGNVNGHTNRIDNFPFASDADTSDVGDLRTARQGLSGQSSTTHGYSSGADGPSTYDDIIDKFPFASNTNASDVGNLLGLALYRNTAGQSSITHGYVTGGPSSNTIQKFSFATDENATDVGDLTTTGRYASGQSSISDGYHSGGLGSQYSAAINKFPFASDTNASSIGNLLFTTVAGRSGQQY